MVVVMEMSSGKALDEACNHYNDVYSDEVLYATWTAAPHVQARLEEVVASAREQAASVDAAGFMARINASQE